MAIGFIGPGFSAIASVCSLHECRYLRRFHMYFTFYILHLAVCRTFLDVDMIYVPSVVNVQGESKKSGISKSMYIALRP